MRIQIFGSVLLSKGGSKDFFSTPPEVTHIGSGEPGHAKIPVGQLFPHQVTFSIQRGAVEVTVLFGIVAQKKSYGLPLQQHLDDKVTFTIDEFQGQAIGIEKFNCYVTPSNEDLPLLHQRLTEMGYVGEKGGD